jgi:hypothetical protein
MAPGLPDKVCSEHQTKTGCIHANVALRPSHRTIASSVADWGAVPVREADNGLHRKRRRLVKSSGTIRHTARDRGWLSEYGLLIAGRGFVCFDWPIAHNLRS